ncbi:MAG: PEP-CTERM sorting domain-containing protein [Zoogloea sp.]|nr:PEP-CTERM sorting domain-containing protein [Zoogloea sp.]
MKKTLLALALIAAGSAQAATITQSATLNLQTTEINQTFNINKFDSTLGTLTGVAITLDAEAISTATLRNTSTTPQRFSFGSTLNLFLDNISAGVSESLQLSLFNFGPTNLAVNVLTDLGTVNPTDSLTFNASDLAAFIGSGSTSFSCTSLVSNSQAGGGGNIRVTQDTQAGCGLNVVYTYDVATPPPAQVPEPASMALVGLGMMGLAAIRRRK